MYIHDWLPRMFPRIAGRMLCGVQVGAVSLLVPRFLTEIAPRRVRGSVGSLSQVLARIEDPSLL